VFTADQTKPQLAGHRHGDAAGEIVVALPGLGYGTAPTQDGHWLLVAILPRIKWRWWPLGSMQVERRIEVESLPQEILIRPDGRVAYVSCAGGKVAAIESGEMERAEADRGGELCGWAGVGEVTGEFENPWR